MFDLDAGKLLVFGIVALAVIPPKDLPRVLRTVGQYVGKMRRMASEFQGQFMDAMKEAEKAADLESVKKEFQSMDEAARIELVVVPSDGADARRIDPLGRAAEIDRIPQFVRTRQVDRTAPLERRLKRLSRKQDRSFRLPSRSRPMSS